MDKPLKLLLIVGTANDIFIYNIAKWLKTSMNVEIDVFEFYPSNRQVYDNKYYDKLTSVHNDSFINKVRGLRSIITPYIESCQLENYLEDKNYDIIQCHWIVPPLVLTKSLQNHCKKLYITFWGREYKNMKIFSSNYIFDRKLRKFLNNVDSIINSKASNDYLVKLYPQLKGKFLSGGFGSSSIDVLYELMKFESKYESKRKLGIEVGKYTVLIGYSGKQLHQHLPIIAEMTKRSDLKERIHILAPMMRGASKKYTKEVEEAIISSGYTYTLIKDVFLSDKQVARLRHATDITLQLSTTDAFSRSIIECFSAKSIVLYGSWLNYSGHLKESGFIGIPVDSIDEAIIKIDDVITNYSSYSTIVENNFTKGSHKYSWSNCIKDWVNIYKTSI